MSLYPENTLIIAQSHVSAPQSWTSQAETRSNSLPADHVKTITSGKMIHHVPEDLALDPQNGQVGMAPPTVTKQAVIQPSSRFFPSFE